MTITVVHLILIQRIQPTVFCFIIPEKNSAFVMDLLKSDLLNISASGL